ncbi:hypothetical protein BUALT_Bualt11G0056300 [Buddleja alternifolia]|uniref:Uncharacterized protein n=1 Tax=Buddleja alternifolia TaxID=168488 RepID=A0AAV6WST5_9LAMI|nr:hypothetical protein BUALT_Bualt11G0056300 [Buddleja alternifolia]
MAEAKHASLLLHNQTLNSLHAALDPKSLILSQFSDSNTLQLTTDSFVMERGPRYKEYSDLRDKKLRKKNLREEEFDKNLTNPSILTPPKKQVKFSSNFTTPPRRPKAPSILTQSVPDFSSALRKENRKPAAALPPMAERSATPPAGLSKSGRMYGKIGGGSKSTNSSAEKRSGGLMARKSYANMDELKGLGSAAGNAINGEHRGGRSGRGIGKTVLGLRQF